MCFQILCGSYNGWKHLLYTTLHYHYKMNCDLNPKLGDFVVCVSAKNVHTIKWNYEFI